MIIPRREFLGLAVAGASFFTRTPGSPDAPCPETQEDSASAIPRSADPWVEISKENLLWNLRQIQKRAGGKPVMAVIKANGYGHGLVATARTLAKADVKDFLVGKLEEARELRRAGVQGQILNFGPFGSTDAEEIVRAEITQNVFSDQVKELDRAAVRLGRRARVQIKVDTGLGRFGVHYERAAEFIRQVAALRGIRMNGVFTTLTEDREFDHVQLERLRKLRTASAREGAALGAWHAASSDAILELPEACREWDMVRPGIMLYGLYPSERAEKERKLELRPVLSLKARVTQVKTLAPGESASYHRAFVAAQPERVATIPCGYSDGLPRGLVGKGSVLVRGRRCPIVAISSNATIARLRDVAAETGDEAVYIGTQGGETVLTSEVATLSNSTVYAVAMGLNPLLPSLIL